MHRNTLGLSFRLDCRLANRGQEMLLAGKAAWAGIVLVLPTTVDLCATPDAVAFGIGTMKATTRSPFFHTF